VSENYRGFHKKKRRGIGSVVGIVFALIAITTTLSFASYNMDVLNKFNQVIMVQYEQSIDQLVEEFDIVSVEITSDKKFNIDVQNTGKIPINLARLWVREDITGPDPIISKYNINKSVYPGVIITDIGEELDPPLIYDSNKSYKMKLSTERGNTKEFFINSANEESLYMTLQATPAMVPRGFSTTVTYKVVNNMSSNNILLNIQPTIDVSASGSSMYYNLTGPIPESYPILRTGDVATFKWVYSLDGNDGDSITFTSSLVNVDNSVKITATVEDIIYSLVSDSSLTTLGLETPSIIADRLIFHEETDRTPDNSKYQMSHAGPDGAGGGESIDFEGNTDGYSWFTQNGTTNIEIYSGSWYGNFRYFSDPLPPSLMVEPHTDDMMVDMIFHFENDTNIYDSTGLSGGLTKEGSGNWPKWQSSGGPWDTAYFEFGDANARLKNNPGDIDENNDIWESPDTTALWFRTEPKSVDNRDIMIRASEDKAKYDKDYYQISIGDGTPSNNNKVVFEYNTNGGNPGGVIKCVSNNFQIDNGNKDQWHHVVAVRPIVPHSCELYIDGQLDFIQTYFGSGDPDVKVKRWYVGYNGKNAVEKYEGDLDAIFHWNDKALNASEVLDLYNQNYGKTASIFHIAINRTDSFGNDPLSSTPVIIDSIDSKLPFVDVKDLSITLNSQPTSISWYDNDWPFRKKITIDKNMVSGAHEDFPVLISISNDDELEENALSNGDDILFTSSDGTTKLDHEIEVFDGSDGDLVAWVKVPSLSSTADVILYMYYGNNEGGDQQNVNGVWNLNYKGVWHLNDDFDDSTSGNHVGSNSGSTNVSGKIADAQSFDGNDHITITDSPDFTIPANGDVSLSMWFNTNYNVKQWENYPAPFSNEPSNGIRRGYSLVVSPGDSSVRNHMYFDVTDGADRETVFSTDKINDGGWHHVFGVRDITGDKFRLYLDGVEDNQETIVNLTGELDPSKDIQIGFRGPSGAHYHGEVDEVRIYSGLLTADWIQTEFNNQNSPSSYITIVDESQSGTDPLDNDTLYPLQDPLPYSVILGDKEIKAGERMKFFMNYTGGLDINLRFDDISMGVDSSGLQFQAPPDPPFPSYFTYHTSKTLKVNILNDGPYGIWFTSPGTRIVFANATGDIAYAAMICGVNSTSTVPPGQECSDSAPANPNRDVDKYRDSIFIPTDNVAVLYFYSPPKDRPDVGNVDFVNCCTPKDIEAGDYRTYIFVSGYDEKGTTFLRQLDLGLVRVESDT